MTEQRRGGKKGAKIGRNRAVCLKYRAEGRREKNKARRAARHIKAHPNDRLAPGYKGKAVAV